MWYTDMYCIVIYIAQQKYGNNPHAFLLILNAGKIKDFYLKHFQESCISLYHTEETYLLPTYYFIYLIPTA